jgi:hypothetical protein
VIRRTATALLAALALATVLAAGVPAHGQVEYEPLTLPTGWEKIEYRDGAAIDRVEYIYHDRSQALLKIKRVRTTPPEGPREVAEKDLEQTLRFLPGYVRGRTEEFGGGNHQGIFAQFDFTRGGKPMLGRHYYLRGDDSTVWVLQFTGDRTALGQIRNVTDQMARAFRQR